MTTVAAMAVAGPALAAPVITSASVTGPTGTVWNTTVDSFYTLFVERPTGSILNPNDDFSGANLTGPVSGTFDFGIEGDGWPPSSRLGNSDPFYNLTLTVVDGALSGTLSGTYTPGTFAFTSTSGPLTFGGSRYTLTDFSWDRTRSNIVGAFSSTDTAYDRVNNPGSGADYRGAFTIDVAAVPEPATWGMMIIGFGAIGAGMRSRRRRTTVAYA